MAAHKTESTAVVYDGQEDAPETLGDISFANLDSINLNQLDAKYEASKYEFWAYCAYYIGNSGLCLYQIAPIAFQNLLSQASQAAGTDGVLHFAGRDRTINSIVLLCNGLSFCVQVVILLALGSCADFGTWRPNILIVFTYATVAIGFSWLGVHTADKWKSAVALYIVGLVAWSGSTVFWTAAFVGLARSNPILRRKAESLKAGEISRDEYDRADSMTRSRYLNVATYTIAPAQVLFLAVCVGILYALNANASVANNSWGLSAVIAFISGLCVLFTLPWFIMEKRRPGQTLPAGMNIIRAGLWQWGRAASHIWRLKQTLFYLIGYFLLTDSFYTTTTMVTTLQNEVIGYDLIQLTYMMMTGWATQFVGVFGYLTVQRRFKLSNKTMYCTAVFCIILLDVWGMIGIWTPRIGFHHPWEFWVYQAWWGLITPYYSYAQIMISEVTPRGKEFLFFSFFNLLGTTTTFVGPIVSSAIIDASRTRNTSLPFYFLTSVSFISFLGVLLFVSPNKSQREQAAYLENERVNRERLKGGENLPD